MGWKYEPDAPNHVQVQPPPVQVIMPPVPQQQYMYAQPQTPTQQQPDPIQTVVSMMTAMDSLKKLFKEEKKDDKKKEDEDKPKPLFGKRFTNFNRSDVLCLSFVLMATSPWTGYWITVKLFQVLGEWSTLLQHVPK